VKFELECSPYGKAGTDEAFAIWRVALPKLGGFSTTMLKATGPTEEAAWKNFNETIGLDETGICRGEAKE
jgi:hypothetical protein